MNIIGAYRQLYSGYPWQNGLIDISIVETSPVVEPVNLFDAKEQLKVTFDDDDSYLDMLIKSARLAIENYTGLALVAKTITVHANNSEGGFVLPYGPVLSPLTSMTDADGTAITNYTLSGLSFKSITLPALNELRVVYTVGYSLTTIPPDLKLAIMHEVAYLYEHRGDEADKEGLSPIAKGYAKMHRRVPSVL